MSLPANRELATRCWDHESRVTRRDRQLNCQPNGVALRVQHINTAALLSLLILRTVSFILLSRYQLILVMSDSVSLCLYYAFFCQCFEIYSFLLKILVKDKKIPIVNLLCALCIVQRSIFCYRISYLIAFCDLHYTTKIKYHTVRSFLHISDRYDSIPRQ